MTKQKTEMQPKMKLLHFSGNNAGFISDNQTDSEQSVVSCGIEIATNLTKFSCSLKTRAYLQRAVVVLTYMENFDKRQNGLSTTIKMNNTIPIPSRLFYLILLYEWRGTWQKNLNPVVKQKNWKIEPVILSIPTSCSFNISYHLINFLHSHVY